MWDISLDSVNWVSVSGDFSTAVGVHISLSRGETHESPRVTPRRVAETAGFDGRCKPKKIDGDELQLNSEDDNTYSHQVQLLGAP